MSCEKLSLWCKHQKRVRKENRKLYFNFLVCTDYTRALMWLIPGFISIILFGFMKKFNKDIGDFDLLVAKYFARGNEDNNGEAEANGSWWKLNKLFDSLNSTVKIQVAFPHVVTVVVCALTALPFFRPMYKYLKFYPCAMIFLAPTISALISALLIEAFKRIFCRPRPAETMWTNDRKYNEDEYLPFISIFDTSQRGYIKEHAKVHHFSIASTLSGHVNGTTSAALTLCMTLTILFELIKETFEYRFKERIQMRNIATLMENEDDETTDVNNFLVGKPYQKSSRLTELHSKQKKTNIIITVVKTIVLTLAWLNVIVSTPLMMASRMTAGRHFFSDCLGAVICSVMTYSISYLLWPDFKSFYTATLGLASGTSAANALESPSQDQNA